MKRPTTLFFQTVSIFLYSLQHVEIKKKRYIHAVPPQKPPSSCFALCALRLLTKALEFCSSIFAKKHKRGCKIATGFEATFLGEKFARALVQMHCQHFLAFKTPESLKGNFLTLHHWVILAFLITLMATGS